MISNRIKKIKESPIRKIFSLAAKSPDNLINLSIGQPHFPAPKNVKNALMDAIKKNKTGYTQTLGIESLREKIKQKLAKENNIKTNLDNIIITSGVSGGLFLSFASILDPGDEIVIPEPYFVLYEQLLNFLDIKIKFLETYNDDFQINPEKLEKLITKKTKAILLNSPNNPTGAVYDKSSLEKVIKIARKNNLFIISDEIYEKFDYQKKFFSPGSIYKKTITLNGFGKSHAITGLRIGFAVAPKKIIQSMNNLQQYSFVCAPSVAQFGVDQSFEVDLSLELKEYQEKREYIIKNLKYDFIIPDGAFYFFIKIPKGAKNFVNTLIKNKILAVPGEAFSYTKKKGEKYFRISYAVSFAELKKAITILNKLK